MKHDHDVDLDSNLARQGRVVPNHIEESQVHIPFASVTFGAVMVGSARSPSRSTCAGLSNY